MRFRSLLKNTFAGKVSGERKAHSGKRKQIRPMVELLKDRLAPATVTIDTISFQITGDGNDNTSHLRLAVHK